MELEYTGEDKVYLMDFFGPILGIGTALLILIIIGMVILISISIAIVIIEKTKYKKYADYLWIISLPWWGTFCLFCTVSPFLFMCCSIINLFVSFILIMKKCKLLIKVLTVPVFLLWFYIFFPNANEFIFNLYNDRMEMLCSFYSFEFVIRSLNDVIRWCGKLNYCLIATIFTWAVSAALSFVLPYIKSMVNGKAPIVCKYADDNRKRDADDKERGKC